MSADSSAQQLQLLSSSGVDPAHVFRILAESIPQLVWTARPDGRLDYANSRWSDYTGVDATKIQGWSWKQIVHPDDLRHALDMWTTVVDAPTPYENEYRLRKYDGTYRWFLVRAEPIFDPEGRPTCWFGTCTDIDDNKRRHVASEERFQTSVENLLDCFGIYTAVRDDQGKICDFRIDYVNQAACENNRLSFDEQIGRRLLEVLPGHRASGLFDLYCQLVESGEAVSQEMLFYQDNYGGEQQQRWFDIRASKLDDGFVAAWRDVTQRKLAELQLINSEQQIRLMVEAGPSITVVLYMDGRTGFANSNWEKYFGITLEEASRRNWEGTIHPDDYQRVLKQWSDCLQQGETFETEYRLPRKDGVVRWHLSRFLPLRNAANGVIAWCGTITDIHEVKLAQEALRKSEDRYHTLFDSIDEGFCVVEMLFDEHHQPVDYRFVEINPAFERHTGLVEAVGKTARQLVPGLEMQWSERYGRIAVTGQRERFVEHSEAMGRWFEVDAFRVGKPEQFRVALLFTDITERRVAQEHLRTSEERLRRRNQQLAVLTEISQRLIFNDQDENELLTAVFGQAAAAIDAELFCNYQIQGNGLLRLYTWGGLTDEEQQQFASMHIGESLCGRVADARQSMVIEDISHSDIEGMELVRSAGYSAYAGFPLIADDRLLGTVAFISRRKTHFVEGEVQMLQTVCDQVAAMLRRQRLAAELNDSEQRIQQALCASRSFTFEWEPKTDRVRRSASCGEILQLSGEDAVCDTGWQFFQRVHDDDRERFRDTLTGLSMVSPDYNLEYRMLRPDGQVVTLEEVGHAIFDSEGQLERLVGVTTDITARKQTEIELRASQARLALGTRVGGLALVEIDYDKDTCQLSAEAARLFGFGKQTCTVDRNALHATFYEEDLPLLKEQIAACIDPQGDGSFAVDHRIVRPADGSLAWIRVRKQAFFEGEGDQRRAVRSMLAAIDVTAERNAESAIRKSEAFIRSVLDSLPEHVAVLNSHGVIVAVNEPWQQFALQNDGTPTASQPIGVNYLDLFHSESALQDAYVCASFLKLQDLLSGKTESISVEYPCHSPSEMRWFLMHGRRVTDTGHVIISHLDITQRKLAEDRLRESESRYRLLFENMSEGFALAEMIWSAEQHPVDWRFLEVNQAWERWGIGVNETLGRTVREVIPSIEAEWIETYGRVVQTGQPARYESFVSGLGRWFETFAYKHSENCFGLLIRDVTERKQADEARRRSEQRLQTLITNLPGAAVFVVDRDLRYVLAEGDALRGLGMIPSDFEGKLIYEALEPSLSRTYEHKYRQALAGDTFDYEHDAHGRQFVSRGVPLRSEDGDIYGVLAFSYDITERKRAEDALRVAGESFRQLVEQSPFGVYAVDADFRLAMVSAGAEKLFANVRPLLGRRFEEVLQVLCSEPLGQEFLQHFKHTLKTGEAYHASSAVVQRADIDAIETYDWKIERVILPDGRPGVVCHFYDLSERQRYEETLRVARGRLETALDASQVVLFHQDRELKYTWIHNPALGYSAQQVIGKRDCELFERAEEAAEIETLKKTVMARGIYQRREIKVTQGGQLRYFDLLVQPDRDNRGTIIGVNCAAVDVTERKEIEERLRDSDRRKDEFLATLSHELRNPLATVRSGLEVMKLSADDLTTIVETRELMERQIHHLVTLVDDLLEVSRITRGKLKLRRQVVTLGDCLASALETCRTLIDAASHRLTVDLPQEPIHLDGDPHRLSQVFGNLLNNAVKYTPAGGQINVTARLQADEVVISIQDTGMGIEQDQLERVFELFAQVKGHSLGYAGLGVGLSLVKSLVELHGGAIWAESQGPGAGSTFHLRLPTTTHGLAATAHVGHEPTQVPSKRVLVVDDNESAARLLSLVIKKYGHQVATASNGQEAIDRGRGFKPDVLLMDIGMPIMDGYEAARAIRCEEWGQDLLMIALTGWGQDDDKQKTKAAGFNYHLVKPVESSVLRQLLADLDADPAYRHS